MIAPQGWAIGLAGLELPAGARNRRKDTVKIRQTPIKRRCHERDTTQFFYYFVKKERNCFQSINQIFTSSFHRHREGHEKLIESNNPCVHRIEYHVQVFCYQLWIRPK